MKGVDKVVLCRTTHMGIGSLVKMHTYNLAPGSSNVTYIRKRARPYVISAGKRIKFFNAHGQEADMTSAGPH